MNNDNNKQAEQQQAAALQGDNDSQHGQLPSQHEQQEQQQAQEPDVVDIILQRLGVSESIATAARAILDNVGSGKAPGENMVKLIINGLKADEDIKNAEAAGYLRGRNEAIDQALSQGCDQQPKPVNFPVYRKRSFWD